MNTAPQRSDGGGASPTPAAGRRGPWAGRCRAPTMP